MISWKRFVRIGREKRRGRFRVRVGSSSPMGAF